MRKFLSIATMLAISTATFTARAQLTDQDLQVGDTVEFEGRKWLLGVNLITNPSFNSVTESGEINGWTVGGYAPMTTSHFQWNKEGGYDGGAYIKAIGAEGATGTKSIVQRWNVEPGNKYYMSFWLKDQSPNSQYVPVVSLTSVLSTDGGQNEFVGTDKNGVVHNGKTLLGKNGEDKSESSYGFANYIGANTWAKTSFFFDSEEYTYLQYNARWLDKKVCFDGFILAKLYDPEVTDALDLVKIQVKATANTLLEYADINLVDYPGLGNILYDLVMLYGEGYEQLDVDEARNAITEMQTALSDAQTALATVPIIEKQMRRAEKLLGAAELYPGADALQSLYDEISESMDPGSWVYADYASALSRLEQGISDYLYSQVPTPEKPADYTFLVKAPHFCTEEAEPEIVDGVFTYPYAANYSNGKKPSDAYSEGWYVGSSGGDQRVNFVQQRICWNAWKTNFDQVSINQELTNLPDGYYSISADMLTQSGCVTDQHLYAKSNLEEAVSPSLNADNISFVVDEPYNGTWETLTTGKFMVADGKATIGAVGTGDKTQTPADCGGINTDYRRGWFLVTNFKLNYYGPLSEEDVKTAFSKRLAELQAMCDTLVFKGDKKAFQDSINKYKGASTVDEINIAMDALAVAETQAATSASKHYYIINQGITPALGDSIKSGVYTGDVLSMAQNFYNRMQNEIYSEDATYVVMDSLVQILYAFRDKYLPVYSSAVSFVVGDADSKAVLESNIQRQVNDFTSFEILPEAARIDKYISELENAMKQCAAMDLYKSGTKDFTSLIVNPGIDNSSNNTVPNGWTISRVNAGDPKYVGSGQQVDGVSSGRYLDGWSGTAGALLYNAYQTIENLPNGKFEVKAMVRTTSDNGVYLYAMADNDSSAVVLTPILMERMNITELGGPSSASGGDSIAVLSNTYGSIFADIYKRTNGGADANDAQSDTLNANGGKGYGWFYETVEIEVKHHTLTIGYTCDSTFTMKYGGVTFGGYWLSADNFSLRLLEEGDNSDWNPTTGIADVEDSEECGLEYKIVDGAIVTNGNIYSINGSRVQNGAKVPEGVYIVKFRNQVKKILVK